jgi:hypothetical protein
MLNVRCSMLDVHCQVLNEVQSSPPYLSFPCPLHSRPTSNNPRSPIDIYVDASETIGSAG